MTVTTAYHRMVAHGEIVLDAAQLPVLAKLDALAAALENWRPRSGILKALLGNGGPDAPRGLFLHGGVGRGKTMLMDLFDGEVRFAPKRRVHFHAFMLDVHDRIAQARGRAVSDPMAVVAAEIAAEARLLCLDELHVTDIADAMILGRLFTRLLDAPVVVVATGNAPPSELYRNGLNRPLFEPFIALMESQLDVVELASPRDHRLGRLSGQPLYFTPADAAARLEMDRMFHRLTGRARGAAAELAVKGRRLAVPEAALGVARFSFADLCETALGAADYAEIARAFHTVMIDGVPILTPDRRNAARRLITLIDTLYDEGVGLVVSADGEPDALYPRGDGANLFERTASRLMEMRSEGYLETRRAERVARGGADARA